MSRDPAQSVAEWLKSLHLQQYDQLLQQAGYTSLDACSHLTTDVLEQVGITPPGHKKRILAHLPCQSSPRPHPQPRPKPRPRPPSNSSPSQTLNPTSNQASTNDMDPVYYNLPPDGPVASSGTTPGGSTGPVVGGASAQGGVANSGAGLAVPNMGESSTDSVYRASVQPAAGDSSNDVSYEGTLDTDVEYDYLPGFRPEDKAEGEVEGEMEEIYVNVSELKKEEEPPPILPPKGKERREPNIELAKSSPSSPGPASLSPGPASLSHKPGGTWKPVPTPRVTLQRQKGGKPTPPPRSKRASSRLSTDSTISVSSMETMDTSVDPLDSSQDEGMDASLTSIPESGNTGAARPITESASSPASTSGPSPGHTLTHGLTPTAGHAPVREVSLRSVTSKASSDGQDEDPEYDNSVNIRSSIAVLIDNEQEEEMGPPGERPASIGEESPAPPPTSDSPDPAPIPSPRPIRARPANGDSTSSGATASAIQSISDLDAILDMELARTKSIKKPDPEESSGMDTGTLQSIQQLEAILDIELARTKSIKKPEPGAEDTHQLTRLHESARKSIEDLDKLLDLELEKSPDTSPESNVPKYSVVNKQKKTVTESKSTVGGASAGVEGASPVGGASPGQDRRGTLPESVANEINEMIENQMKRSLKDRFVEGAEAPKNELKSSSSLDDSLSTPRSRGPLPASLSVDSGLGGGPSSSVSPQMSPPQGSSNQMSPPQIHSPGYHQMWYASTARSDLPLYEDVPHDQPVYDQAAGVDEALYDDCGPQDGVKPPVVADNPEELYQEAQEPRGPRLPPRNPPAPAPTLPPRLTPLTQAAGSRDSVMSFHEPPPAFSPPPLPGDVQDDFSYDTAMAPGGVSRTPSVSTVSSIGYIPSDSPAPPALPPRPKNYTPSPTGTPKSKTPPNRDSTMSFSDFAQARVGTSTSKLPAHLDATPTPPSPPTPHRSAPAPPPRACSPPVTPTLQNVYTVEPMKLPPPPPPRGPNPFKEQYDADRGTYTFDEDQDESLDGPVSPTQRAATAAIWESDDNLSDGGDFYHDPTLVHQRPRSVMDSSIPVIPATENALKDKKGYLFKRASSQSQRMGWKRYWVTFDGDKLKYFSSNKSKVSKRLIPVSSLVNVEQKVKHGDSHPYQFKLTTIDRVYSFAAEHVDDLTLWTSILMRVILDTEPTAFQDGGSMNHPDKEGFMKMEGVKGKRYIAIKGDKLCYYNTYNDFKGGSPIHEIEMKLGSVKDTGRNRLQLTTPYAVYVMVCESGPELAGWKESCEEAIAEGLADDSILKEVYDGNHSNRYCADCGAPDPHWASINLAITLCKNCAGIHRMLHNPRSKVRSLRMDLRVWTPTLLQLLQQIGNDNGNNFWEWNTTEDDRIDSDVDMDVRKLFILNKYSDGRYLRAHPLQDDPKALNEALCKSVQYGDVLETMQLVFSGADLQWTTNSFGGNHETPVQLAKNAKQMLQTEFLYQNGAEGSGIFPTGLVRVGSTSDSQHPRRHYVTQKGYLSKMSSGSQKEFSGRTFQESHRPFENRFMSLKSAGGSGRGPKSDYSKRWCVLEHGILSFFDNEKSTVAKDTLERKEIMSISVASDDKNEFGFEIGTTKVGRTYMYGAENQEDQVTWMSKIAKTFAPLPMETLDTIRDFHRGGIVFLRDGATTDWAQTWIQLRGKQLSIFKKDEQKFEEVDLRKVTGIKSLQRSELCLDAFDDGPPFVIDLPKRALYIQGDLRRETEAWLYTLQRASTESGGFLVDQQLTAEEVPVIVQKCIGFVATFGLKTEGIYRLSGQHSKVTALLELFKTNARDVHLTPEEYVVHDVATALKRYFRTLEEPLLTGALYQKWINTANMADYGSKMQWYKYLLGELPRIHYNTLKKLMGHLARVAEWESENKMSSTNIASIFGPILMNVDKDTEENGELVSDGFKTAGHEIAVCNDLLSCNQWLFEVKDDELEHERKIQEALDKIEQAKSARSPGQAGDLLIGVYIHNQQGDCITTKVPVHMTAEDLLEYVVGKAQLEPTQNWGLYEVILQDQCERALHYKERVLDVTLRWTEWPEDFCKHNYLCVKNNYIYSNVEIVFDPQFSLFSELKYSEKKGFKKYCFEFNQFKLSYHKDTRAVAPLGSWKVEDMVIYMGVEPKRGASTKHTLTFINKTDKIVKSRESPFFGHTLCFSNTEELYKWLASMLHAQHPDGLTNKGAPSHIANQMPSHASPFGASAASSSSGSPGQSRGNRSFFSKLMKR